MVRCLIMGSSGVLANCLAIELSTLGIEVVGLTRSIGRVSSHFKKQISCDYNVESLTSIINLTLPDFIVNTVAEVNLVRCQRDYKLAYKANVEIPMSLAKAVKLSNLEPYVIHISTDNVYSEKGYSLEHETKCLNNYAFSKLMGELAFADTDGLVLRTNYLAKTNKKITYFDWVLNSFETQSEVTLFSDVYFNATSICNIVENVLICFKNRVTGVVNLGSKGSWTKEGFHLAVLSVLKSNLKFRPSKCPQNLVTRPLDMRMNIALARSLGLNILSRDAILSSLMNGATYDF